MQYSWKRLLSLLLTVCVVLSCALFTAFATGDAAEAVAVNTTTGTQYDNLTDALLDAEEGQTVRLEQDVTDSMTAVFDCVTLDLNGYTLTTRYMSCYGDLIDSSEANSGLLKVDASRFMLREENSQLTVKTAEGYRFVEILGFNTKMMTPTKYAFQPLFEAAALELLAAGKAVTGVSIQIHVGWMQSNGARTQDFTFNDSHLTGYVDSYKAATGKYGKMFALTLNGADHFDQLTFTAQVVSDTGVSFAPAASQGGTPGNVTTDEEGKLTGDLTLESVHGTALVPQGVKIAEGVKNLTLATTPMSQSGSGLEATEDQQLTSLDVHIEGIAADNDVSVIVTLRELAPEFLNQGNITLYHVENGQAIPMTRVYSLEEVDAHNEYYYDIATGTVTLALTSFSEIVTRTTAAVWEGKRDYTWYDPSATELKIYNADQLAGLSAIVGKMDGQTRDSFAGKTIKLMSDIDLNDAEDNNHDWIFYPIGYSSSDGIYEKTGVAIDSNLYTFCGTFDGNGHTIKNFYQNTWEMKGDHYWYDAELQYYRDGMGLFGKVYGGTVKNLTIDNFSCDSEIGTTGCAAAFADCGALFENITVTNCNPRVYNIGNGGIVGSAGWYAKEETATPVTFRNITVDSSNKISALWGSWGVSCGGILGQYYPTSGQSSANYPKNAGIVLENCHVAAQIDVNNDVCSNYQYYLYRYAGMLIGSVRENVTDENGNIYPKMDGITADGCTVLIGNWKNYYYCEMVVNTLASYTHDHQFSRLENISNLDEIWDGENWLKAGHYIIVNSENMAVDPDTCYHIMEDEDGNLYRHFHEDSGYEDVDVDGDGVAEHILKEDRQRYYIPFENQLVTGDGMGVNHLGINDLKGVTSTTVGTSCDKFVSNANGQTLESDTVFTVGDLFQSVSNPSVSIYQKNVQVFVSPADEYSTVSGSYAAASDWTQGKLTLTGTGLATITITDYYFCNPTTITVNVVITKTDSVITEAPTANTLTYTGSAQALVSGGAAEGGTLVYCLNDENGTYTEAVPMGTGAGIYTVYYKVLGDKYHFDTEAASVKVTIEKATPSVTAPTAKALTYTGSNQALVNAGATNGGTMVYSLDGSSYSASIPTGLNAGDYTVYYKVWGDSNYADAEGGSMIVTIAKATASATVKAASTWTYDGEEYALVTESAVKGEDVVYSLTENGEFTTQIPTAENAGEYTVYYKVLGNNNYIDSDVKSVTVTVQKAQAAVETAPVVKQELTYNKDDQPLVDAGTATGGTIWYKVEKQVVTRALRSAQTVEVDEDGFSPAIPTAKNAGNYTVYYKVKGDANHNDTEVSQVTVTVKKATPAVNDTSVNATYGEQLKDIFQENVTATDKDVTGSVSWSEGTVGDAGTTGNYTVTFVPEDTENYESVEVNVTVTVQKADPQVTAPTVIDDLAYTGAAQALVNAGSTKGGTMVYSLDGSSYNASIPTGLNAGEYTVYYKVQGDSNYNDAAGGSMAVTIAKVNASITSAPTANTLTYTGSAQTLVSGGQASGGRFVYSLTQNGTYASTIKATDAGDYTVYYKVQGDANHNDTAIGSVSVTIAKATASATVTGLRDLTYTGSAQALVQTTDIKGADVLYSVNGGVYSDSIPTGLNAGTYTVSYKVQGNDNYITSSEYSVTAEIAKGTPSVTAPTTKALTYTGAAQALVNAGSTNGGTMVYSLNGSDYDANIPSATAAGDYTVYYKVLGDSNYNDVAANSITVTITAQPVVKFAHKFPNTDQYMYRVGNVGAVSLNTLFKAVDGVSVNSDAVTVTIDTVNGTAASGVFTDNSTWTSASIKFSGTGVVKVTITDDDYCIPTELYLEVIHATNATSAANATANNVVLLQDVGFGSVTVSGGYTLYGNGFTMTCGSDLGAKYLASGFLTLENGVLDNVRIVCPNFSNAILYTKNFTENNNPTDSDGRYYNVRSAVYVTGNSNKILNSYISGARAAVYAESGTLLIENSTIEGGAAASIHAGACNLTLKDITLIQEPKKATVHDTSKTLMGLSVIAMCDGEGMCSPITLEGTLTQYAWACEDYKTYVPSDGQSFVSTVLKKTAYTHQVTYADGTKTSVNLGFLFMPASGSTAPKHPVNNGMIIDNRTDAATKPYSAVDINSLAYVYSYTNSNGTAADMTAKPSYSPQVQAPIMPDVSFTDTSDARIFETTYDITKGWVSSLRVDVDQGDYVFSFAKLLAQKYGYSLNYTITTADGTAVDKNATITLNAATTNEYNLTITDDQIYDQNGQKIQGSSVTQKHIFQLLATKTSLPSPEWTSTTLTGTPYIVVDTKNSDWNCAVPVLDGIKVTYWSKKQGKLVNYDLGSISFTTSGPQNGNNNTLTIPVADEFTLTITTSGFKTNDNGKPVVVNGKLYFTVASSSNYVSTSTTSRTPSISYTFTDANNSEAITLKTSMTVNYAAYKSNQYKYSDFCNGKLTPASSGCVTADTLVTLADGSQKRIDAVTAQDQLLVWDHFSGKFVAAPAAIIFDHGYANNTVIALNFSDGTTLKVVNLHQLLDADLKQYVTIKADTVADYVGHSFVKRDGDSYTTVTLDSYTVTEEYVEAYGIISAFHYNLLVADLFSTDFMEEDYPLFNYFAIGEDMKFDQAAMQADIARYGLYTYEDFADYVTYEQFVAFNIRYMKVSVGKGVYTYEEILALIDTYLNANA